MATETVGIVGAGYVGLSMAACFAHKGFDVILAERDQEKVELIRKAKSPFYEKGLEETLEVAIGKGNLHVETSTAAASQKSRFIFIAVGTPSKRDGSIDLGQIKSAAKQIGFGIKGTDDFKVIIVRSTVVPGTTEGLARITLEQASGKTAGVDFGLASMPEFLREGNAIEDTLKPNRIVVGSTDQRTEDALLDLLRKFYDHTLPPLVKTKPATAETIKYASNIFLAAKVSLINEIADLCELVPGTDVKEVAKGVGLDERIGSSFLDAGLGFGGSCFPKDTRAFVAYTKKLGRDPVICRAVLRVNANRTRGVMRILGKRLGGLRRRKVAVLGLAFKPGTDDLREAPSLRLISALKGEGASVAVYDPIATPKARELLGKTVTYALSAKDCVRDAEACIIATEWPEFRSLRPQDFSGMNRPLIIDGRRVLDPKLFDKDAELYAVGLGL